MKHQVRQIIAQHKSDGRAYFATDELVDGSPLGGNGSFSMLLWNTDTTPANNMDTRDGRSLAKGLTISGGTSLRVVDVSPSEQTGMHRTLSVDYVIVTKGELDLELEGGETRTVRAGDVIVQRGTNHRWINRSGEWAQIIAILISADPPRTSQGTLQEVALH